MKKATPFRKVAQIHYNFWLDFWGGEFPTLKEIAQAAVFFSIVYFLLLYYFLFIY